MSGTGCWRFCIDADALHCFGGETEKIARDTAAGIRGFAFEGMFVGALKAV
jgi:hypothetical protein